MYRLRGFGCALALAIVIVAAAANISFAQGGTSAIAALQLGQGIRAAALGEAYVAEANDPVALYYNPAGLGHLESGRVDAAHELWYGGIQREHGSAAFAVGNGGLALSASYLHLPPLVGYDGGDTPIGDVTAATSVISGGYGVGLPAGLALGLTASYYNQQLADVSNSGMAFTAGAQWSLDERVRFGAAVRNFGPAVKMQTVSEPLPREYAVGVGWTVPLRGLAVSAETTFPRDGGTRLRFGAEYFSTLGLAIRTGYTTYSESLSGSTDGLSLGAGFALGKGMLDYSYTPGNVYGGIHRFGISWLIGNPAP